MSSSGRLRLRVASGSLTAQVLKREAVMTICTDFKQTTICFRLLQAKQLTNKPARERHGTLTDLINQFTSFTSTPKTLSHLCHWHSCFSLLAFCRNNCTLRKYILCLINEILWKTAHLYFHASLLTNGTILASLRA